MKDYSILYATVDELWKSAGPKRLAFVLLCLLIFKFEIHMVE